MTKQVENIYVYGMEADPCAVDDKYTELISCEDVIRVSRILRASLANPERALEDARSFADKVSPKDKTLHQFISKIVRQDNDSCAEESWSSQIITRTDTYIAQTTHDDITSPNRKQNLEQKDICCQGKICTHLLDLIILSMAAARNFAATSKEKGWYSTDKCLPTDSLHDESETKGSFFRVFSLKVWKRGIESVGLFRERTAEAVPPEDERTNSDHSGFIVDNKNMKVEDKDELKETHVSKKNEMCKCTEKYVCMKRSSTSAVEQATETKNIHEVVENDHMSNDTSPTAGEMLQTEKAGRKLADLKDLVDDRSVQGKEYSTEEVKKLQLEKEMQREERNALQTQTESLIKENREIKASLEKLQLDKDNLAREYKTLQADLDKHERSTRHHTFMLNTRLERLQHAKLAAHQSCLKLSLERERFVVYEQHIAPICQRIMKTVRRELQQTQDLFDVSSTTYPTRNEGPVDEEPGFTMYEAHHRLERQILKLIKRYKAVLQLLTGPEDRNESYKDETRSQFYSIEERRIDPFLEYEQFDLHRSRKLPNRTAATKRQISV